MDQNPPTSSSTSGQRDRERGGNGGGDRERISSFEQMKVWQEAHALVLRIFELTPRIPPEQQEGLAAMLEKAAVEVPKFIAEGFKRRGSRNKAHYYNMAQSGLEGLRYLLILGRDLKFDIEYDDLAYRGDQVSRMLDGLVRSMTRTERGGRGGGRRGGGVAAAAGAGGTATTRSGTSRSRPITTRTTTGTTKPERSSARPASKRVKAHGPRRGFSRSCRTRSLGASSSSSQEKFQTPLEPRGGGGVYYSCRLKAHLH